MIYVILSTRHPIFSRSPHFHVRPLPGSMALATGRADKACRSAGAAARPAGDVGCSCISTGRSRHAAGRGSRAGAALQRRPDNHERPQRSPESSYGNRAPKVQKQKNRLQERPYPANISYMKWRRNAAGKGTNCRMEIRITKNVAPAPKPSAEALGFGQVFTDHMFLMEYDAPQGWHDARIVPYAPLALPPAAAVFHYGAEVFEGLKAYRAEDGRVQLFRPADNIRRMQDSAERLLSLIHI